MQPRGNKWSEMEQKTMASHTISQKKGAALGDKSSEVAASRVLKQRLASTPVRSLNIVGRHVQ